MCNFSMSATELHSADIMLITVLARNLFPPQPPAAATPPPGEGMWFLVIHSICLPVCVFICFCALFCLSVCINFIYLVVVYWLLCVIQILLNRETRNSIVCHSCSRGRCEFHFHAVMVGLQYARQIAIWSSLVNCTTGSTNSYV